MLREAFDGANPAVVSAHYDGAAVVGQGGDGPAGVPGWNFHKIRIGRDGKPAAWFPTRMKPENSKITAAIEGALARPTH